MSAFSFGGSDACPLQKPGILTAMQLSSLSNNNPALALQSSDDLLIADAWHPGHMAISAISLPGNIVLSS
jgi:hypothetical protein